MSDLGKKTINKTRSKNSNHLVLIPDTVFILCGHTVTSKWYRPRSHTAECSA